MKWRHYELCNSIICRCRNLMVHPFKFKGEQWTSIENESFLAYYASNYLLIYAVGMRLVMAIYFFNLHELGVDSGDIISIPRAGKVGRRGQPGTLIIKLKVNISYFSYVLIYRDSNLPMYIPFD